LRQKFRSKPAAPSMASHPRALPHFFPPDIASQRLVCTTKLRM